MLTLWTTYCLLLMTSNLVTAKKGDFKFTLTTANPNFPSKNTPERLQVLVFTMHGPSDSSKEKELSEKGKDIMQMVGTRLMNRYENHIYTVQSKQEELDKNEKYLNEHDPIRVGEPPREAPILMQVTAVGKTIAKSSASEIIRGIKECDEFKTWMRQSNHFEYKSKLKIEFNERDVGVNKFFDPLRPWDQEQENCKGYETLKKKLGKPEGMWSRLVRWVKGIDLEEFYQKYEKTLMDTIESKDYISNVMESEMNQMRKIAVIRMRYLIGDNTQFWRLFISQTLTSIFGGFKLPLKSDDKVSKREQHPRLHIHVVDEYLMAALLWWFRVETQLAEVFLDNKTEFYPQPGDSFILEINDLQLQAFYQRSFIGGHGLTSLFLERKFREDFKLDVNNLGINPYTVPFRLLVGKLFVEDKEWERCCIRSVC